MNIGFDRYDFNTGKKVFTPNNGPSVTPSSSSPTVTGAEVPKQPALDLQDTVNLVQLLDQNL